MTDERSWVMRLKFPGLRDIHFVEPAETAVPITRCIGVHICPTVVNHAGWRGWLTVAGVIGRTLLKPLAWHWMLNPHAADQPCAPQCDRLPASAWLGD